MKTATEIQGDVYQLLKHSALCSMVSGDVYRAGMRPRDSKLEDIVVIFTAGFTDQIQTGIVTINIYIPDIDPYANGVLVMDSKRAEELERAAQDWVDSLTSVNDYLFGLSQTVTTMPDDNLHQHFVVVKLRYQLLNQ